MEKLDNPNLLVRAVERWKRGLGAALIIAVLVIASSLVASLFALAGEMLGLDAMIVGTIALLIIAPWIAGDRRALKAIGSLSSISDD